MNGVFGDYYDAYKNPDWASQSDGKYTIKVKSVFKFIYGPAPDDKFWDGSVEAGSISREKAVTINLVDKQVSMTFTKTGDEFRPDMPQHWETLEIESLPVEKRAPLQNLYALSLSLTEEQQIPLELKSDCKIIDIVKKE